MMSKMDLCNKYTISGIISRPTSLSMRHQKYIPFEINFRAMLINVSAELEGRLHKFSY